MTLLVSRKQATADFEAAGIVNQVQNVNLAIARQNDPFICIHLPAAVNHPQRGRQRAGLG
jgi:hypothetical protein